MKGNLESNSDVKSYNSV